MYRPKEELDALTAQAVLEAAGIKVVVRSFQIPWYDGVARFMRPEWGEVLVADEDLEAAEEVLKGFFGWVEPKEAAG